MSKKNNNYVNMLSSYGYGEQDYFETYPEERRNWRKAIRKHMDEEFDETREHVTDENNRVIEEVESHVTEAKNEIKEHVTNAKNDINGKISSAQSSIDQKLTAIKTDTADILSRGTYWWSNH